MTALVLLVALAADEPREILCLYNSTEQRTAASCEIALYLETVLNYLGLIPVYRDVEDPLPDDASMTRYRAVLTWFTGNRMKKGRAYWAWMARQPAAGRRVVILGNPGGLEHVPAEVINAGLRPLGLTYRGKETGCPTLLQIRRKTDLVEFERTLDGEFLWYVQIAADPGLDVHLRVRRSDVPDSDSDLAVLGPHGGFSWVTVHYDSYVDRDQWRLNPFTFLTRALGIERLPRPDLTTAMGRRIFFASIDGDGLANGVQPGPRTGRLCGEVIRDEFIRRIDLPVTASVIAADLDRHAELARSIFALPNVEPAAHGYYHPVRWQQGTLAYPGEFDLRHEVVGSVRRIEEISPKPVKAYLWTGDCMPPAEAIAMCDAMGIANLNGPDPGRYQNYESLANLRAPTFLVGGSRQFNARSMSENHYTDHWTRNFFAFRNALWTFRRTDAPRRVVPLHVYFHFYLAEQPAGEAALREIYDWVLTQEIFPMTVSEYVAWVRGFFAMRLENLGGDAWRALDYGACRTLRFDDGPRSVDLSRSKNVLGFRRVGGSLYVHLGPGREAIAALGDAEPARPYLVDANGDWTDGKIVARTAASAVFMTPGGPVRKKGAAHEMEVELR
jgi:hypothetical protein